MTQISNELLTITTSGPPSAESVSNDLPTILAASPSTASISNDLLTDELPALPGDTSRKIGASRETALDEAQNPPNMGPAKEVSLDEGQNPPNMGPVKEVPLDEAQNPPNMGPAQEQALEALPSSWVGAAQESELDALPVPPPVSWLGSARESDLSALPRDLPGMGPAQGAQMVEIGVPSPFVNDVTVVQRDTARTFLTDIGFSAGHVLGAPLTAAVDYQRGGTGGAWLPCTPQEFDRQHDPEEGGLVRPDIRQGLQVYYKFDQNFVDSGELARDLIENGNVPFGFGLLGDSAQFNNMAANFLTRGSDDPALNFGGFGDFGIQVLVRHLSVAADQVLVEKFNPLDGSGWSLVVLADGRLRFRYGNLLVENDTPVAVADGEFHQIFVRRFNRVLTLWYDAVQLTLVLNPPDPINALAGTTNPLLIGRRVDGTLPAHAEIDELAIWTGRSLSFAEIGQLWNGGAGLALEGTATVAPGTPFNFVWKSFFDLGEGEFTDVFIRVSVTNNPTTSVVVGPFTIVTTTAPTDLSDAGLARKGIIDRTPFDFLGCGLLFPFRRASRDFANDCGVELIRSSVRFILGTRAAVGTLPGDLRWRPDFGSKHWILRHQNNDAGLEAQAVAYVLEALQWEPRIQVVSVEPFRDPTNPNQLQIRAVYEIIDENIDENRVLLPEFEEIVTITGS